jgi:hypothetical protein
LTRLLVDVEVASVLAKQAHAFAERRTLAQRYIARMMPRVRALSAEIRDGDTSVLEWIQERGKKTPDDVPALPLSASAH